MASGPGPGPKVPPGRSAARGTLNELVRLDLLAQGVSASLVEQLTAELAACKEEATKSDLMALYKYAGDGSFEVTVNTLGGTSKKLEVKAWTTVGELKGALEARLGISSLAQRLVSSSGNVILDDVHMPLAECQLGPVNSSLTCVRIQRLALAGAWDGTLKLFDLMAGDCVCTLRGHRKAVTGVVVDCSHRRALSSSTDNTLKVWDLHHGECTATLEGHSTAVSSVAVDWSTMRAVSGSEEGALKLWDLERGVCLRTYVDGRELDGDNAPDAVNIVVVEWSSMRALSGHNDGNLVLWDLQGDEEPMVLTGHFVIVSTVVADWPSMRAVSGAHDCELRLWDLKRGVCTQMANCAGRVQSAAVDWDTLRALSCQEEDEHFTMRLWDLREGAWHCVRVLQGFGDLPLAMAVDWTGLWVLLGHRDGTLQVWDVGDGELTQTLDGHSSCTSALALFDN